jgi:hypothetical protein
LWSAPLRTARWVTGRLHRCCGRPDAVIIVRGMRGRWKGTKACVLHCLPLLARLRRLISGPLVTFCMLRHSLRLLLPLLMQTRTSQHHFQFPLTDALSSAFLCCAD